MVRFTGLIIAQDRDFIDNTRDVCEKKIQCITILWVSSDIITGGLLRSNLSLTITPHSPISPSSEYYKYYLPMNCGGPKGLLYNTRLDRYLSEVN